MALEFQFAFLGPEHNYIASLTKTSSNGCPQDDPIVEFHGLPTTFCAQHRKFLSLPAYIYNIRGHDFLSFVGQWQGCVKDDNGPLNTNRTLYNEIDELEELAAEERTQNKVEGKKKQEANFIASFGPSANSFFADAFHLEQYRWRNLPYHLEKEVQKVISDKGWVMEGKKKIYDVAMNAVGGWVMQLNKGKEWRTGGQLGETLENALIKGKRNGVSIARLFLNHQHPTEYVLLFSDGIVHAQLDEAFRSKLQGLLHIWFKGKSKKNKNIEDSEWFHFTASSDSRGPLERQMRTAAYYARRGLFHHIRGNNLLAQHLQDAKRQPLHHLSITEEYVKALVLAHKYLRQANAQHPEHPTIQKSYVEILKAVRNARYDPILEDRLCSTFNIVRHTTGLSGSFHGEDDDKEAFRNEYERVIGMLRRIGNETLAKELEVGGTQLPEMSQSSEADRGWSYAMATDLTAITMVAMESAVEREAEPNRGGDAWTVGETESVAESVEGSVYSHLRSTPASSVGGVSRTRKYSY